MLGDDHEDFFNSIGQNENPPFSGLRRLSPATDIPVSAKIVIQIGQLDQRISLVAFPRHFGGRQWYFVGDPAFHRKLSYPSHWIA